MGREPRPRYIEVAYTARNGQKKIRCSVLHSQTMEAAEDRALANAAIENPGADDVELRESQTVLPSKAREIERAIDNGTWRGWER